MENEIFRPDVSSFSISYIIFAITLYHKKIRGNEEFH